MALSSRMDLSGKRPSDDADVVLGDDWIAPRISDADLRAKRERRRFIAINRSPLAQKIITFNLVAIILMVAGILYLNPFRDSLVTQREMAMVTEAVLIADMLEVTAGFFDRGVVDDHSHKIQRDRRSQGCRRACLAACAWRFAK